MGTAVFRRKLSKKVGLGCFVGLLWIYHLAFPLYRLHDGQVVRRAFCFPPVERLQRHQVSVALQSQTKRLFPDPSSSDGGIVEYRPAPFWVNSGVGSRDRMGWPARNTSLIIAIWGTIFCGFLLRGRGLTQTKRRKVSDL